MYNCYVHGWSSCDSMCPSCFSSKTTAGNSIEINWKDSDVYARGRADAEADIELRIIDSAFDVVALEDKLNSALKLIEEMAKALGDLKSWAETNHEMPWFSNVIYEGKEALDKYKKFKEDLK